MEVSKCIQEHSCTANWKFCYESHSKKSATSKNRKTQIWFSKLNLIYEAGNEILIELEELKFKCLSQVCTLV